MCDVCVILSNAIVSILQQKIKIAQSYRFYILREKKGCLVFIFIFIERKVGDTAAN